ncbi:hypothetical protein RJZ56_007676 [Blastomyces dermatitidis]|uniref:Uncharacterized protein n=2 Tax=Ajellomyces dermatitidis TaxID=5039 RepID=F2TE90_AJEDA|nr:uncharacterized protein BDCG_04243 [Blastomyces dermatitidis ER-3]EEQ89123.1 hypothetical protein BDCG_04243 [Blastomyces dermatitidis ER-3]EGE81553.1 hypothetical protein BDDG_04496 [Blastomyces dermatitidis ATCC 18188]
MPTPTIQVLCKQDFTQQHIVSIPDTEPLPPLSPSSVRVKTYIFSLTANNVSYAKAGHLFGWWDVHPLPPSIPEQFKDAEKYGRISAWGYGVVKESNRDDLPIGSLVYGYLPIGTLPVDLELSPSTTVPGKFHESSPARAKQFPVYNEYLTLSPSQASLLSDERRGWDALLRIPFSVSHRLNRYVFAWDEANLAPPSTLELGPTPRPPWTMEHADMKDAVVILLAASGKNATTFAHQLKSARPAGSRPRKVIAVTSQASKAFVEVTGFYDLVCLYGDIIPGRVPDAITGTLDKDTKVIVCDFGGRGSCFTDLVTALKPLAKTVLPIGIGSEPKVTTKEEVLERISRSMAIGMVQVNASDVFAEAAKKVGKKEFEDEFSKCWGEFLDAGGVPGLKMEVGEGMDAVGKGWDKICSGELEPETGLVFKV